MIRNVEMAEVASDVFFLCLLNMMKVWALHVNQFHTELPSKPYVTLEKPASGWNRTSEFLTLCCLTIWGQYNALLFSFVMSFFGGCCYGHMWRHRCPVEDRDEDTEEEETNRPSRRCRSDERTSDWLRMTNHLLALQLVRVTMTGCLKTTAHENLAGALMQSVRLSVCLSLSTCPLFRDVLRRKSSSNWRRHRLELLSSRCPSCSSRSRWGDLVIVTQFLIVLFFHL